MIKIEFNKLCDLIQDFNNIDDKHKKLFFSNALAGEVGESCNLVKHFFRDGHSWNKNEYFTFRNELFKEYADVFIYLVLCSRTWNFDLEAYIYSKINEVNEKRKQLKKLGL